MAAAPAPSPPLPPACLPLILRPPCTPPKPNPGGSEAHSAFFQRQRGDWEAATQSRDLLTSVRRFYSNAYADADKQDALNLFLGVFRPQPGSPHIWELGGDTYLHSGGWRGRVC